MKPFKWCTGCVVTFTSEGHAADHEFASGHLTTFRRHLAYRVVDRAEVKPDAWAVVNARGEVERVERREQTARDLTARCNTHLTKNLPYTTEPLYRGLAASSRAKGEVR